MQQRHSRYACTHAQSNTHSHIYIYTGLFQFAHVMSWSRQDPSHRPQIKHSGLLDYDRPGVFPVAQPAHTAGKDDIQINECKLCMPPKHNYVMELGEQI